MAPLVRARVAPHADDDMESIYQVLGFPDAVGGTLFGVGLALFLAPYLRGVDFGLFVVPTFGPKATKSLRFVGPVVLVATAFGFYPWVDRKDGVGPPTPADVVRELEDVAERTRLALKRACRDGNAAACRELAKLLKPEFDAAKAQLVDRPGARGAQTEALRRSRVIDYLSNRASLLERIVELKRNGKDASPQEAQLLNIDDQAERELNFRL